MTVDRVHEIIDRNLSAQSTGDLDGLSKRLAATVKLGKNLWSQVGSYEVDTSAPCNVPQPSHEQTSSNDTAQPHDRQKAEKEPTVKLEFSDLEDGAAFEAWFSKLSSSPEPPYQEQENIPRSVYSRILLEERDTHVGCVNRSED